MIELKLPELGEDVQTVEVTAVLVKVGDPVRADQPVIEVETEKASLEVPAAEAGTVARLQVQVGDMLNVGDVILAVEAGKAAAAPPIEPAAGPDAGKLGEGSGPPPVAVAPATASSSPEVAAAVAAPSASPVLEFPAESSAAPPQIGDAAPAAPSSRALARQLGVDIRQVRGSGRGGRISREDVKAHAKALITSGGSGVGTAVATLPDFSQWGPIDREPLSGVRRATARGMANAWNTVPHVTQFDHADITQLESMRRKFNARPEAVDRKLSMTAIVVKMLASVLRQFPRFNASLDLANDSVVHKRYCHIGVAADTDRGLLVPVVRDVDRKSLVQVTTEIAELAARARNKKLKPDEMRGATFTVSNLGGLGTTYFSPIVNWPEVAILGVGRAEQQPVLTDGQFQPRLILPLSLSYDHRLIDGADAARFQRRLAEALEQPLLLLLDE